MNKQLDTDINLLKKYYAIDYKEKKEINYLHNIMERYPYIDYKELDLINLDPNFKAEYDYQNLALNLQKKIVQQGGYIQEAKYVVRSKGGDDGRYYVKGDGFIDDNEQQYIRVKKQCKFQNFKCLSMNMQQFYASQIYKQHSEEIQGKRTKQPVDKDQMDKVKKKVSNQINYDKNKIGQNVESSKDESMKDKDKILENKDETILNKDVTMNNEQKPDEHKNQIPFQKTI